MAYEIDFEREHPCPCDRSTFTVVGESNDWGSSRERWKMNCPDCRESHVLDSYSRREGERQYEEFRWVPADSTL